MNRYEEKKQARIERFEELAEKAEQRSQDLYEESRRMASVIPLGQPILVGHYSEKADRNYRARIHKKMHQSCEEASKADYYRRRADAAQSNRIISSDDPEAVVKLKAKIETAEKLQVVMREANKIVRSAPKNKRAGHKMLALTHLGIPEDAAWKLFEPDFCGRIGFPDYALTNNNANIKRMRDRLQSLEHQQEQHEAAGEDEIVTEYEGFQVVQNFPDNRIQIVFDGKDAYLCLCKSKGINLKREGFKYAKSTGAWQRHLNNAGRYAVESVIKRMTEL